MKKIKGILSKFSSFFMALIIMCVICFVTPLKSEAATPKGYITVSVEKFTLGLGYVIEPVKVPFYEGDTGAKIITRLLGKGNYINTGSVDNTSGIVGQTFYLSYVKDNDARGAKVPSYIMKKIKEEEDKTGEVKFEDYRDEKGWLGEFDYTFMSGWMYAVNKNFPGYGSGQYKPKDGDVMRWQYTLWGYGADLGNNGKWGDKPYIKVSDKDKLTTKVAEINSASNKSTLLKNSTIKSAYNNAYKVLENITSSQSEVDSALSKLTTAVNNQGTKTFSVYSISDKEYTGKEVKPSVTVKDGSETLKSGTDYTLSYSNNKNVGTATVSVTGKGSYKGTTKKVTFKIEPRKVTNLKTSATTNSVKLTWNKVSEATGYRVYRYNSKTKSYDHVTTIGKNSTTSYTNTKRNSATNYSYKVRAYKAVNKTNYYGNYSDAKSITTKPLTPSIKLNAGSKKIGISWNKISGASGYEVYRATSKSGKYSKVKTITSSNTSSYTNTKLTKGKNYYYKVRAYKTVNGSKTYSSYSSVKYVKAK